MRKFSGLFLSLLLATAVTAVAQSPTTSAPNNGTSVTHEPYGATLDHPNPNSKEEPTSGQIKTSTTPTTDTTTMSQPVVTPPAAPATTDSSATTSSSTSDMSNHTSSSSMVSGRSSLPRTASELPLLGVLGLLAFGGALGVRTIANRRA